MFSDRHSNCFDLSVHIPIDFMCQQTPIKFNHEPHACPRCAAKMISHGYKTIGVRCFPYLPGLINQRQVAIPRYMCTGCFATYIDDRRCRYPKTRLSYLLGTWIEKLLVYGISVSSIARLFGVHWDTVRKIHKQIIESALVKRASVRPKPRYLAVDEFAIHKRHRYASCVVDLETKEIIWVGKDKTKRAFQAFFDEVGKDFLSEVKAVACDMNAAYSTLIKTNLPQSCVVYDHFHIKAQFGRDVLGAIRMRKVRQINERIDIDKASKATLSVQRIALKKARWSLLTSSERLSERSKDKLVHIFEDHQDLAVAYAFKEEMTHLFCLRDEKLARKGWMRWFEQAIQTGIPELVRFARLKKTRLEGLVSHALYPIGTGPLEGINNKIKVAKRIGYGYRNDEYFFSLIRYLSIPEIRCSHTFA